MRTLVTLLVLAIITPLATGEELSPGDKQVAAYFQAETANMTGAPLADIKSLEDWQAKRGEYQQKLKEMLGLDPWPEKTDLKVTTTGTIERDGIVVEKIHFQSRPGLYVTANLYRPAKVEGKLPAVLYVCGHGRVVKNGISYGNKSHYQHHGAWFARHGFVCLTLDTLQLGEIEGKHRGLYDDSGQWWTNRGYTPAGVEAWNCVRAIDLLQSRDDVDPEKIGVTGRSGGGAYSWYIAAIDERIKAAVPVAGITDLEDHVVNGVVSGHCDCMYWVNTYGFDYPLLPALIAPRPLMIANTDYDPIFPLEGVERTHLAARKIYQLYGKAPNLALTILPGGHADTQPLRIPAFYWLRQHLQGAAPPITDVATPKFEVEELKVFDKIPEDEINTKIEETFVAAAKPAKVPATRAEWKQMSGEWKELLATKSFAGWPEAGKSGIRLGGPSELKEWMAYTDCQFYPQKNVSLPLLVLRAKRAAGTAFPNGKLVVVDDTGWKQWKAFAEGNGDALPIANADKYDTIFVLPPRGIGPTQWTQDTKPEIHLRRRYLLLGQSHDAMQVWDIRRAAEEILRSTSTEHVDVEASGKMAALAIYAAIFEPSIGDLTLRNPPLDHREGPYFMNVRRFMNMPEAMAMAANDLDAPRSVNLVADSPELLEYANQVKKKISVPVGIPMAAPEVRLEK
ncbi:acetylxylan esterase [Blastopirellula marina]|uniref:Acetylxylan esterase n=1 Tax=Blastopirellula marina TaxID=124 RepID=A0A2S8F5T9_9BACT|nr:MULTISPECIES: CocE/NonD family hydrolase [Pirellulaceae]PQO27490.1 acetylxylan esterase [Blastopirellula marina]RCS48027.1 acetylxylan esterase [Bremerella cremea]